MKHIDLLNAVLALRFKQPGWPTVLAEVGYVVQGIGVTFKLQNREEVAPDILASANARAVTLLWEVKSGANVDYAQLGRMESVTPEDLRDFAHLRIPDPTVHKVGIVYVCNQEDFDGWVRAVDGRRATVVGFNGRKFSLGGVDLPDNDLAVALATAQVESDAPPLAIVPFDQESSLGEVGRVVIPVVVKNLVRGLGVITADGILQTTHNLCLDAMRSTGAGSEVDQIKRRITELLREAAKGELSPWLARVESQPLWRITVELPTDSAGKTRELQKLARASNDFLVRIGAPGAIPLQLDMFDIIDDLHRPR